MQVKLLLFTFYLNGGLHEVYIRKPSERISNFWTVQFLKIESEPNFGFPHIPADRNTLISLVQVKSCEVQQNHILCCHSCHLTCRPQNLRRN